MWAAQERRQLQLRLYTLLVCARQLNCRPAQPTPYRCCTGPHIACCCPYTRHITPMHNLYVPTRNLTQPPPPLPQTSTTKEAIKKPLSSIPSSDTTRTLHSQAPPPPAHHLELQLRGGGILPGLGSALQLPPSSSLGGGLQRMHANPRWVGTATDAPAPAAVAAALSSASPPSTASPPPCACCCCA
jgi:hypothetical protein